MHMPSFGQVVTWVLFIGVIAFVWNDPTGAANLVHDVINLCKQGVQALITFVRGLT